MVRKTLPDGGIIEYTYDRQGNLLSVDDGYRPLTYEYDPQNRLIAEHQGWGTPVMATTPAADPGHHLRLPDNNQLGFNHDKGAATLRPLNSMARC